MIKEEIDMKMMIDILKTVLVATGEYEARYHKAPVLFVNRSFYECLVANTEHIHFGLDNLSLCGYPVKVVFDDSDEIHFWVGEQKTIYEEEN